MISCLINKFPRQFRRKYSTYTREKNEILISSSTNPFFNLALEEYLFNNTNRNLLFLWRNEPTVVIGKHQNPWKECHIHLMEEDNVHLVRRRSGGGAVYQDLGNSIWTFIDSKQNFSIERNIDIVRKSIDSFGFNSEFSGRNDIHVEGKKISGSAFKHTRDRSLHHGTVLINIDKDRVEKYLNVNKEKLISKGVQSVRQRILNLCDLNPDITHEKFVESFIRSYIDFMGGKADVKVIEEDDMLKIDELNDSVSQLKEWEWRFGKTPNFEYNIEKRFQWGIMDVNITSENGKISQIKIYSDCLYPIMIEEIEKNLYGISYDKNEISKALSVVQSNLKDLGPIPQYIDEFKEWLMMSL